MKDKVHEKALLHEQKGMHEPEFDPNNPDEYMAHRHSTLGFPKPFLYPKNAAKGGKGKKIAKR